MRPEILRQLLADRAAKRTVVLATDLATGREHLIYPTEAGPATTLTEHAAKAVQADRPTTVTTDDGEVFLNVFNPPLRMLIVGAVHIAQPLAPIAGLAGYEVTLVDPRGAWATEARFPGVNIVDEWPDDAMAALAPDHRTAIVTLTHDPKLDDPALAAALNSEAFYIGSLGSNGTHAKRLQRLETAGFDAAQRGRVHGPIGLDIGARSPAEIALAIMAQVTEVLRRSSSSSGAAG